MLIFFGVVFCRLFLSLFDCPWNSNLKLSNDDGSVTVETAELPESGLRNCYT